MRRSRSLLVVVVLAASCSKGGTTASSTVVGHAAVTLFGSAGGVRPLRATTKLPHGQSFSARPIRFTFPPGQSAWFASAVHDGTVLIPGQPQTTNPAFQTATGLEVSYLSSGSRGLRTLNIPTSRPKAAGPKGQPHDPNYQSCHGNKCGIGGADIEDSQVLSDDPRTAEVAFDVGSPWNGWNQKTYGTYPSYFTLTERKGQWAVGTAMTGKQIQESNRLITPGSGGETVGQQACPDERVSGVSFVNCLTPAEMAVFPASRDVLVAQYSPGTGEFSGHLMVLDRHGRLIASYPYPAVPDPDGNCVDPAHPYFSVHPREVQADPTSVRGVERFVVVFDTWHCHSTLTVPNPAPFLLQEFTFNANLAGTAFPSQPWAAIAPVSAAVGPSTATSVERSHYDQWGNLWVGTMQTTNNLIGGALSLYVAARHTLASAACSFGSPWGTICPPDVTVSNVGQLGQPADLEEQHVSNSTSRILLSTASGQVLPITAARTPTNTVSFTAYPVVDLDLAALGQGHLYLYPSKGAVQDGLLWIPIQQQVQPPWPGASGWIPDPPAEKDQWLYRLDLGQIAPLEGTAAVSDQRR